MVISSVFPAMSTAIVVEMFVFETLVFKTFMVKTTTAEIFPVFPFKIRTVVRKVETIPVMSVPGRVIVISITREFVFVNYGCRSIVSILADWRRRGIFILVHRGGRRILILVNYHRSGPGNNHPGRANAEAKMGVDIYL